MAEFSQSKAKKVMEEYLISHYDLSHTLELNNSDGGLGYGKEVFDEIAPPVRLCIVRGLWRRDCSNVTFMQECLDIPQSTVSQHLGKLRQAGIIQGERNGLEICYSLKDPLIEEILKIMFEENKA